MGPPARASGPMWPMQAPVETPEKRASVRTATCFPQSEVFQGAGDLVDFFHARAHRAAADEDDDVVGFDLAVLDGGDGGAFGGEDAGRAGVAVDAVGVDDGGVDGGAFDDGAFGGEVADGEGDGAGKAALAGAVGAHDDVVGIDVVLLAQDVAKAGAAVGAFPPVE